MITRALDAGVPAAWVAGDEVYGANPGLRAALEARQIGYVLAVACDYRVALVGVATPTTAGVQLALRCETPLELPGERQERLGVNSPSLNKLLKGFGIPLDTVLVERLPV